MGLAQSLAHPGGNVTGVLFTSSLGIFGKQLALLKELAPETLRVAAVFGEGDNVTARLNPDAARNLKLTVRPYPVARDEDAITTIAKASDEADALCFASFPTLLNMRDEIVALVARMRRPAIYPFRDNAAAGGLMSYGASLPKNWAIAAEYVAKILAGASPGDPPIQQPDLYDLVINLKSAKAQGITIPTSLLVRADEVIE